MRLGILAKALKRTDDAMLTRQELEHLIKVWPDENGVSDDPETYNAWKESEQKQFWRLALLVLGADKINALSEKQARLLDRCLARLFLRKPIYKMTEEEILGQYELVTVHIAPIEYEIAWAKFHKKQTKH